MTGRTFSGYLILDPIGRGAFGEVYQARDTRFGRMVAIKFLPEQYLDSYEARARFEREGRAASALSHSNICAVYDAGQWEGRPFIAMELLEGCTLKEKMRAGLVPRDEMVEIAYQVAGGLEAAHERGILHRDVKPSNIFLTARRRVKLLDFGLAKMLGGKPVQIAAGAATVAMSFATLPGTTLGTLAYMAPEQARGEAVDRRADLFSLGVVVYEAITGRLPAPDAAGLDAALHTVVRKLVAPDRQARYANATQLRADLQPLRPRQ